MDGSRGTFDRSSLRDDKKKQQKIVSNNLKKLPGGLFLRFFLTDEDDTDQSILRSLRPSGETLRKLIAAIVTIGFTVVLIGDLLDLAISGTWRNSTYGRVSYIITAITFVPSQVSFTRCCASCIFLLARNKEIVRSIRFILTIRSGTTLARQSHDRVLIVRARLFYAMVMALSISALLLIFLDPVFWLHYPQKMQLYNFLSFRGFDIECYIRSLRILAAFVNTSVAVLLQILYYLYAEHAKMVLEKMSNCATGVHQPRSGVHREKMVQEVQKMRDSYEQLIGVKDCLERTFSMLLLIHIATIFMDIMIALAWLYTWSVVPSTGNAYLATKTILEGCGSLLRMVFLLATPLNLCLLSASVTEAAERILLNRQEQVETVMSVAELDLSSALLRRIRTHPISVSANIIPLDLPAVLSGIFWVFGFFCYIVERLEEPSHTQGTVAETAAYNATSCSPSTKKE